MGIMKDMQAADDDITQNDKRVAWLIGRISSAYKPWIKKKDLDRLDDDDQVQLMKEFLDHKESSTLFVYLNGTQPTVCIEPVEDFGAKKALYFLKRTPSAVKTENIAKILQFGELHPKPLESLLYAETHINPPLLQHNCNMMTAPERIHDQLREKFDTFRSGLLVTQGLSLGRSQLPLPSIDVSTRGRDKDFVYQLESVLVGWANQIKQAIQLSPSSLFEASHPFTQGIPSVLHEIKFWQQKAADLQGLEEQLATPTILKILNILKTAGSSYSKPFQQLQIDLRNAAMEAADILRFLTPLSDGLSSPVGLLAGTDTTQGLPLNELVDDKIFEKLFHFIYLIWDNSKYYNTSARLIVLIRELCNDIINSSRRFIEIDELFMIDCDEAMERLTTCLAVCGHFKSVYFKAKSKAAKSSTRGPWRFHNNSLFTRLDSFLERCHDLLDVLETHNLFSKLDPDTGRVIIGGTHGPDACAAIAAVYSDFCLAHQEFIKAPIDHLEVEELDFDTYFTTFRNNTNLLEKKLGTILVTSLLDSKTLSSAFKLIDSFEGFLDRSFIQQEWLQRQVEVVKRYQDDLFLVQETISEQKQRERRIADPRNYARALVSTAGEEGLFPTGKHTRMDLYERTVHTYDRMPPTAAKLAWARALLDRITQPLERLTEVTSTSVQQMELWSETMSLQATLVNTLNGYLSQQATTWVDGVSGTQEKLSYSLLVKSGDVMDVNFDKELTKLLKEVAYVEGFNGMDEEEAYDVPESAKHVFTNTPTLRRQILKLEAVCSLYNSMKESMLPVERPLVDEEFKQCDDCLSRGITSLTWVSPGVDEFIDEATRNVSDISNVLQTLSKVVKNIEGIIKKHIEEDNFLPLDPKDSKTMSLGDFVRKYTEYRGAKNEAASKRSVGIAALLESGFTALNTLKVQKGSEPLAFEDENWSAYVAHVNGVVRSLVVESVVHSLTNLSKQVNSDWISTHSGIPLLDIKLALAQDPAEKHDTFVPALRGTSDSLESMVLVWCKDLRQDGGTFQRLDEPSMNFSANISDNVQCEELGRTIARLVSESLTKCEVFQQQFKPFADLWSTKMEDAFAEFLGTDGTDHSTDDEDAKVTAQSFQAEFFNGLSLDDYSKMIVKYDKVHESLASLPDGQQCGWLRIDAKPIKIALKDYCNKWKNMYVQHLVKKTRNELTGFNTFIKNAEEELEKPVDDGDLEGLKNIMKWIRGCKRVNDKAQVMFEPIREVLEMLKRHQCVSDEVLAELEDLRRDAPDAWSTLYKKSLNVREEFSKIQDQEADRVDEQATEFQEKLVEFSDWFDNTGPFEYLHDTEQAYEEMDEIHLKLFSLEENASRIHAEQMLFELARTEFRLLKECRLKLKMLKGIWDLIAHVRAMFSFWYGTPFLEINVDDLTDEVTKLFKQLKGPSTKAKSWKCFEGLHTDVKKMSLSLPLIQDLREEAMRERHWSALFKETGHAGMGIDPRSPSCTLEVLMSLDLHNHQEAVQNTVEKAMKELQLEANINKVAATWDSQELTYVRDEDLSAWVLTKIDDIVEVLDTDTNMLQQMQSNRFVDFFQEPVNRWMDNLGRIESILQAWMDVQKRWVNLYPIFITSQDIRMSLPDDAKLFESADELYRELMDKVNPTTNVVEICCTGLVKKLLERDDDIEVVLTIILDVLKQCEKSLADYLESKKKIFPRFFFLADSDLVDILSKSSIPVQVMAHMSKVIDAIDTFTFLEEGIPDADKCTVDGFVSLQGESIQMPFQYRCEGAVESWLDGCVSSMKKTMKAKINDANVSYMENPRISWIFNHCCQAVVVASRIQFTWETNVAFNQLEDGNETALKDHLKVQQKQLSEEIRLVLGTLTPNNRAMLVHLITIDVHNRDVVQWLIDERAETDAHFTWQSQLRYHWDEAKGCVIKICDSEFNHGYEYIGLCGCLVVTKLTDRCYITLTQALKLVQGGAPAGPAGTGKTETTKDLARNLGNACYVFNCSDQMDYRGLGRIFKGLAMSGCWGCFDEFNRISIEVLSVVATQVSSILYGIRTRKKIFKFANEEDISLNPNCGMFITMNPGYAGRTELPENIKSLFRPCAMVVPDIQNICEILLAAEGFVEAKDLALKFVQLYRLNKELLSQQLHYDWGLRAVKSVLVIAGNLRQNDPDLDERLVLLRALRDTNLAKLSKDDVYVFKGLIKALFPNMNVNKRVDKQLQANCISACTDLALFKGEHDIFILKCLQLDELLSVRHSVFILGPAGSGKTECRNALKYAYNMEEPGRCRSRVINPKAITSNELYGCAHEQTKEWKEGHLSHIFKEFSVLSKTNDCAKWVVLDGIIDTEWIESMNTVMDDNKMLTLANNDRIPLTASMRMVFEISQLRNASPATVSRAGILYINDTDLGWAPFKDKWLTNRKEEKQRNYLDSFFDAYLLPIFEYYKRSFQPVIPIVDINIVQSLCSLLEAILDRLPLNTSQDIYERYFCFAAIWAFGGPLSSDSRVDYRALFSKWWIKEMQHKVKVCEEKYLVFDFYIDDTSEHEFRPWTDMLKKYHRDPDIPFSQITVETVDTVRTTYLMNMYMKARRAVMLVGTVGTGKSVITNAKLRSLDPTDWVARTMSFNAQSTARALQQVLESNLERGGRKWHPPARKQLMFFIDDINMPLPDKYGTQDAIALLRQYMDYGFWFDRSSPGVEKHVTGIQFTASMNHKAGSFTILDRLQRWFSVLSIGLPPAEDLNLIYTSILASHLKSWSKEVRNLTPMLVNATIELHQAVREHFLPTATKFHYQWNLREMANIFQGLTSSVKSLHDGDPVLFIRLWRHECERTFRDRMVSEDEIGEYEAVMTQIVTKHLNEVSLVDDILQEPNIWAPFGQQGEDLDIYDSIDSYDQLSTFLEGKLTEYNDDATKARMDLVLFKQAMSHVARICRILAHPKGNALLIGVGGSGKRSLSRLAAFINELDVYTILVTSTYNGVSFRRNMSDLYLKCGRKNQRHVFIITDAQVVCPDQLVVLNDMLNSGNVASLFEPDTVEELCSAMVPELRQRQHPDYNNKDVCWKHFISKVQTNLHTVLCFSPVGQQLAMWCRQFPAIANCTVIDWFHPWPEDALASVSNKFLAAADSAINDEPGLVTNCADSISDIHLFVTSLAEEYRIKAKRHCYTTPKSYMEMIGTYKRMLQNKRDDVFERKRRLVDGLQKIKHAQEQVSELQVKFKEEDIEVRNATSEVNALMEQISTEKAGCQEEAERAELEKIKTEKLLIETDALRAEAERDLAAAQPLVERAKEALKGLNKASLTELKSFTKPPQEVLMVTAAVMCLTAHPSKIPKPEKAKDWANAKKMMANVSAWLKDLEDFGQNMSNNIPQACIDAIQVWVKHPDFDAERMMSKSEAASCLSAWVCNMDAYHTLRCQIRPKEERLAEASERLEQSKAQFKRVQDHVAGLNAKLGGLVDQHNIATEKSRVLKQKAESTRLKMNIAERLVSGLADENVRWGKTTDELGEGLQLLVGDVLMASAFISYAGPFSSEYRERLVLHITKTIKAKGIPHTEGLDVVTDVLTSEAEVAGWNNEGLPTDRISTENGAIVKNAKRWPLLVDPQQQGVTWIKAKEEKHGLIRTQQGSPTYLDDVITCLEKGLPCLIENLPESIDPILEPVLGKEFTRKGNTCLCKVGDLDVHVDIGSFRLYLQTKLPNPHYKPELNAQTTLVNFMVTETGLEDQLLAVVVNKEQPELEEKRVSLIRQMNQYKIDLSSCEDRLLYELSNATGELLENVVLIQNLEQTKKQAGMIAKALIEDRAMQEELMARRMVYKPAAIRGSLLYFEIDRLSKISTMYQYSLDAFMNVFNQAIDKTSVELVDEEPLETREKRETNALIESITQTLFAYVSRGLFEKHKIIFSSLVCFSILKQRGEINPKQLEFLLTGGRRRIVEQIPAGVSEWCTPAMWSAINSLSEVPGPTGPGAMPSFDQLPEDIQQHNRWKLWTEHVTPEGEKLPTDWRNLDEFQRLLIIRCLRPDRLIASLNRFVASKLGTFFTTDRTVPLSESFADSGTSTPIFFILSPGVDPVRKVEALGAEKGFSYDKGNFFNVSLGQGQEGRAVQALQTCFTNGGWVMLSNIHLARSWLLELENLLDKMAGVYAKEAQYLKRVAEKKQAAEEARKAREEAAAEKAKRQEEKEDKDEKEEEEAEEREEIGTEDEEEPAERGHPDFRLFLSAEPSPANEQIISIGILQRCIKLTNEPPSGMKANMVRAFSEFKDEPWENSCKPADFKAVLFSMCWFHSIVVERKKFGKLGWNREYPFNMGDLTSCINVLNNYMEERPHIPWDDLRYVFGEIIYGGHITDDWDRRLCAAYLEQFIKIDITDGMELCEGFHVPTFNSYQEALACVEGIPGEHPTLYGLHAHAELGYHIQQADYLFKTINELQPKSNVTVDGVSDTTEAVQAVLDDILNNYLADTPHHLADIAERLEDDKTPQQHVFYQECERMNMLQAVVKTSLQELNQGLQGALAMSEGMLELFEAIRLDKVPDKWQSVSFMSRRGLGAWCVNMVTRNAQLIEWSNDLLSPKVTRLDFLFNPMSFITSICQYTAMLNNYELDQMDVICEPSKRMIDGVDHSARDGAHIFGLKMEGARWDVASSTIDDSKGKELFCTMPVITIKALPSSKVNRKDQYPCPLYKTQQRGNGYVTTLYLRTKQPAIKWTIAGVACVLDVDEM
eukprot:TRINITY_DN8108_c0_g1_i3.p1 TRINITY_DN8108_c0_g1~~TRINITY_DN8108_c0_g1_i3.p1  ORF type:complete len:4672 (+),score=1974.47 TRINITY_DN8108_c0_g1_i3:105-14120(+)